MIDIETRLVDSLHAEADPDRLVDTGRLRMGAIARARTIRIRRRAAGAVTAAGLAAVVGVGLITAPRPDGGGTDGVAHWGGETAASVGTTAARPAAPLTTTLPPAAKVPPAAEDPAAVGTDPALFHFDIDFAALGRAMPGADASEWTSGKGYEKVSVPGESGTGPRVEVIIAPDAEVFDQVRSMPGWTARRPDGSRIRTHEDGPTSPLTVQGKPGTLRKTTLAAEWSNGRDESSLVLVWQPRDGLYAFVQVFGGDQAFALTVADAIRLDRAQRCAVPLRLTDLPAGAAWSGCRSAVRHRPAAGDGAWRLSELLFDLPGGGRASVWAEEDRRARNPRDVAQFAPNRTVAGHPAQWRSEDPRGLWLLGFGAAELFVSGVDEPDAVRIVEGLTLAGDLAQPATWPQRPVN